MFLLLAIIATTSAKAAEWKAAEKTEYYYVSGSSPNELYRSIGQKGPLISGERRTIAVTNWDLKWRRNYQPKGSACELTSALPFVSITYTLPKPSQNLSGLTEQKWTEFFNGIKAHEKVHGDFVKELAQNIITDTVGLRVENDKACKKIRDEVINRVSSQFNNYKEKNRAFEQAEMAAGGNVRKLVLDFVN